MRKSVAAASAAASAASIAGKPEPEPPIKSRAERRRLSKPRGIHAGPPNRAAKVKGRSLADQPHSQKREIERRLRQAAKAAAKAT